MEIGVTGPHGPRAQLHVDMATGTAIERAQTRHLPWAEKNALERQQSKAVVP